MNETNISFFPFKISSRDEKKVVDETNNINRNFLNKIEISTSLKLN